MLKTLLPESSWWKERTHSLYGYGVILVVGVVLFAGVMKIVNHFFPKKQQVTSTTRTNVASGGVANITNINNSTPETKQGVYGRLSSTRAGVGVFKEVTPNIDVSLGGSKKYDSNEFDVEVETRLKF